MWIQNAWVDRNLRVEIVRPSDRVRSLHSSLTLGNHRVRDVTNMGTLWKIKDYETRTGSSRVK